MRIVLFWSVSLFAALAFAEKTYRIEGQLKEKGTRKILTNSNVFILPHKLKATTDEQGKFVFENVPEGSFNWIVNLSGFIKLEKIDLAEEASASNFRTLYIERESYEVYETTIYDKAEKRDDRTRTMKVSELAKMPGSQGDPIKAIQNLPGVNRPMGISSQVIIEGSAPQDTKYMLNSHEIPIIFHFGGLTSVVFPEVLESIDYLAAGYGPEYSRAIGGLIGATVRSPRRDRYHGVMFADTIQAGGLLEGNFGESTGFFLSARQSYIGHLLKAIIGTGDSSRKFNLTLAPTYSDALMVLDSKLSEKTNFRVTGIASSDTLQFLLDAPVGRSSSGRGTFYNYRAFYRLIPELIYKVSDDTTARFSLGAGRDFIRFDFYDDFFDIKTYSLSTRGEIEQQWLPFWKSYIGYDNRYTWAEVGFRLPSTGFGNGASSTSTPIQATVDSTTTEVGAYFRNVVQIPETPLALMPNLRVDYFKATRETNLQPRVSTRYALSDGWTLRGAVGLYVQPPQPEQTTESLGNPDLKAPRAWHYTLGFEKDWREGRSEGVVLISDVWYRDFDKLVATSRDYVTRNGVLTAERYNNSMEGHAVGISNSLRFSTSRWSGMISYTLSESRRNQPTRGDYRFQYDQTHILNAVARVELAEHWALSARLRYTTGNAFTPYVGAIYDSDDDIYRPIRGAWFSDRFDPFMTFDIRLDKKWVFETWILSLYLDVQNIMNRKNVESVNYSYDYSQSEKISLLPMIPSFGLKGEF